MPVSTSNPSFSRLPFHLRKWRLNPKQVSPSLISHPPRAHALSIRRFSSRPQQAQHPNSHPESRKSTQPNPSSNPEYPSFSFADLGANRTVKITVLIALSIVGTMETVFYAKALWRYFAPPDSEPTNSSTSPGEPTSSADGL